MTPRQTPLGRLLQERREALGYSRPAVGAAVGISPGTIEGWELGRVSKPPINDVWRLARYLRIGMADLDAVLLEDGEPPTSTSAGKNERRRIGAVARTGTPEVALLRKGIELFGWSPGDVAELLRVNPARVEGWLAGQEAMSTNEVLGLQSAFAVSMADRAAPRA